MSIGIDRRLRRLEGGHSVSIPWHLPMNRWSDEQLRTIADGGAEAEAAFAAATDDQMRRLDDLLCDVTGLER